NATHWNEVSADMDTTNRSIYAFAEMDTPNRPAVPYITLIALACKLSPSGSPRVKEIYEVIRRMYPFYRNTGISWQNGIRHALARSQKFEKSGSRWRIIPKEMIKMEKKIKKASDSGFIHPSVIKKIKDLSH
ncbi:hypothetical protein PFISCL1PPCAC_20989, partial [Pristionchus fissidentatus]